MLSNNQLLAWNRPKNCSSVGSHNPKIYGPILMYEYFATMSSLLRLLLFSKRLNTQNNRVFLKKAEILSDHFTFLCVKLPIKD